MMNEVTTTTARVPAPRLRITPARWLTLVLAAPVLFALIGWTAFSAVDQMGNASFPVSYTFPAAGNGPVNALIEGGNITLQQTGVGAARLTGIAHYTLFRSTVTTSDDTVRYHCPTVLGDCELDGTLQVPASSAVSLSTGGGDVKIQNFTRYLTLRTGGGNLNAGSLTGGAHLITGGGDVTVSSLGGSFDLNLSGGNLNVQAMTSPTATIESGGGVVTLTYTEVPKNLYIKSNGGNVTLVLPRDGHYAIGYDTSGGNVSGLDSVHNDGGPNKITVNSGGGHISFIGGN